MGRRIIRGWEDRQQGPVWRHIIHGQDVLTADTDLDRGTSTDAGGGGVGDSGCMDRDPEDVTATILTTPLVRISFVIELQ